MPRYRHALPQLGPEPFLTDGGIETTLIFQDGLDLPDFAAFLLLESEAGRAAQQVALPVAISFTVETDGRLPTGQALPEAIAAVDAATGGYPAYYMLNCAHPSHFESVLVSGATWTQRLHGLRANASRKSHAELDTGNPDALAQDYLALVQRLPHLNVLGGGCGTDTRHIDAIATTCLPQFRQPAA